MQKILTKNTYLKNLYVLGYDEHLLNCLKNKNLCFFSFTVHLLEYSDFMRLEKPYKNVKFYKTKDGYGLPCYKIAVMNYEKFNSFREYEKAKQYRNSYKKFKAIENI